MDFQFYPTYPSLARRMWRKFKNRNFTRVLEPEAGDGDLADQFPETDLYRSSPIDCIEIDVRRHATLRGKGYSVVGVDFLTQRNGYQYSHVIMNPPYALGAAHVLKAWEILWEGEIVALVNAQTIRNPNGQQAEFLCRLVSQFGSYEIIEDAFNNEEAVRKAQVDVALIHLVKTAAVERDVIGDLFAHVRSDSYDATQAMHGQDLQYAQALAIPENAIENAVLTFNAAVVAMQGEVFASARAHYYRHLIGKTMAEVVSPTKPSESRTGSVVWIRGALDEGYRDLKNRAWTNILQSSNVTERLSVAARQRIHAEFEQIKALEFSVPNIYGFLCGLIESQGKIRAGMVCDIFDLVSKYHSDNVVYYRGWVSNSQHRTCGMRIKAKRFILPGHGTYSHQRSFDYNTQNLLGDFDRVFAMLDGKEAPEVALREAASIHFTDLRAGQRISSSYFDLRYYPGIGTLHFFPTRPDLVDRLNRVVGRYRQWLPEADDAAPAKFWDQFNSADRYTPGLVKASAASSRDRWSDPISRYHSSVSDQDKEAGKCLDKLLAQVQLDSDGLTDAMLFGVLGHDNHQTKQLTLSQL